MTCAVCGSALRAAAPRCLGCGTRMEEAWRPDLPAGPAPAPPEAPPRGLHRVEWGALAAAPPPLVPLPAGPSPAPAARGPGFALGVSCGSIAVYFGVQVAIGIVLVVGFVVRRVLGGIEGPPPQAVLEAFIIDILPVLLLAPALAAVFMVRMAEEAVPDLTPRASRARTAVVVLIVTAICFAGEFLISTLQRGVGADMKEQDILVKAMAEPSWAKLFVLGLSIAVIGPLGEELVFRRLGYRALAPHLGVGLAALLTGLAFAVVHFNFAALFIYFWIACCCVAAYELTGRFWAAFGVHAINNAVVFVLGVVEARR